MNLLGMGSLEILLILALAFIFLGPDRMIDAARMLGKLVREGRKLAAELPQVVLEDDDIKIINKNDGVPRPNRNPSKTKPYQMSQDGDNDGQGVSDGPIAHQPTRPSPPAPSEPTDEPPAT
ncbi:MAG: twin-arginine translocase TatA/TatE family subunit [Chloroflexi bacterium]|nr:twin-arginine translocase TatA/TatE family subunit [Chloroflexota bacterium]